MLGLFLSPIVQRHHSGIKRYLALNHSDTQTVLKIRATMATVHWRLPELLQVHLLPHLELLFSNANADIKLFSIH